MGSEMCIRDRTGTVPFKRTPDFGPSASDIANEFWYVDMGEIQDRICHTVWPA